MILYWSWVSLPCLSMSAISLSSPSVCVFLTFLRFVDALIIFRMYFLMFSFAFFLMVFHISAYSSLCLSLPFSTISRRFVIRARVGDDILDSNGLLIALASLDTLCWIMSVMVCFMVSMSSSSCSVSNRCLTSSWNSIFFYPICVVSTLGCLLAMKCFRSTSTSSLMLLITILWSLPTLTWLIIYVCDDVRLYVVNFDLRYTVCTFLLRPSC